MFITADQLVAHAFGDYVLQSDWMASEKTKKSLAALAHVSTYFLPFLFLTTSWKALLFIAGTHFVIDRWRLARYVCWVKNFLAPRWVPIWACSNCLNVETKEREIVCWKCHGKGEMIYTKKVQNPPWALCSGTGYSPDRPPWLATWLLIITDNLLHAVCNAIALTYLS